MSENGGGNAFITFCHDINNTKFTSWNLYRNNSKRKEAPEEADIQQIVAYAVRMNTQTAILVYPSMATQSVDLKVGEVNVRSLIFNIGVDLDEAGRTFLEKLMKLVKS